MAVRRALPNLSAASPVMLVLATVTSALAVEKVAGVGVWRKKAVVHRLLRAGLESSRGGALLLLGYRSG